MWAYYKNAVVCYVYLDIDIAGSKPSLEELKGARWMYRGWYELSQSARPRY
jgi:hypothetical protein